MLFMLPIVLSALAGGIGPGLVATLVAALGVDLLTSTPGGVLFDDPQDFVSWALLVGNGALVSILSGALHLDRRQAAARRLAQDATRRALSDSEGRLKRALAASGMGVWEWDVGTNDVFASPECREILGIEVENATLASLTDLVDSADAERLVALAEQAIVERTTYASEFRVALPDGRVRWLASAGRAEYASDGDPVRLVGTVQEVTDRHAREQELARATRAYATLSQVSKTVSAAASRQELFAEVCRIAAESAGYRLAWIGWLSKATHEVVPLARAGEGQAYVDQIRVFGDDRPEGQGPAGICIREHRTVVCRDFLRDPRSAPWREAAAANDLRSVAAMPIHLSGDVCGVFAVYAADPNVFQAAELTLLKEAAESVSFALVRLDGEVRRKQVEASLAAERAHLRTLVDTIPDLVWLKDPNGVYLTCNPAFERFFGAKEADIVGRTDYDFVDTELADFFRVNDRRAMAADGASANEEWLTLADDGRRMLAHTIKTPMRDGDGQLIGVLGIGRDITAAREAQQALEASEEKFRLMVEGLKTEYFFYRHDVDGVITYVSPAVTEMLGYTPAEAKRHFSTFLSNAPINAEATGKVAVAIGGASPPPFEAEVRHKDGSTRQLEVLERPTFDAEGAVEDVFGIAHDVTERRLAETRLKESQNMLASITEAAQDAIAVINDADRVVLWNAAAERLFGYSAHEMTGREVHRTVVPDRLRAVFEMAFAEFKESGRGTAVGHVLEVPAVRRDGQELEVELSLSSVQIEGRWHGVGIVRDITRRKQTEATLRKLSTAVEQSPVSIVITDLKGAIEYVNPAFTEASGYSLAEAVGQNSRILQSGCTPSETYGDMWTTLTSGGAWHGELINRRKNGTEYTELATISPVRHADGKITHYLAVKEDITERKRIETELVQHRHHLEELVASRTTALMAAEEHARLILASSAAGLFGIDTAGRATFINPAACTMLGYTREQMFGQALHALIHRRRADGTAHPEDACPIQRSIAGGEVVQVENDVFWRADGTSLPVQYAAHPMYRQGQIVGAVVSFFDVTAQREAEAARSQALAEAQRLARVRSEFLANMSHEIRTPLNAVLGMAQIGQRKSHGSAAQDQFRRIVDSGELLLAIVNDILDFSRIEAGKLELEQVTCDLGDVIDRAVDLIATRAKTKGLELLVEEAPDLPAACKGDPVRLTQVLVNLLSNAEKFTRKGGIILSVEREGERVVFRLTDTGIGMSPDQIKRLFTPFEQVDGATTRRFGGTGLGLAISKRLIDLMGGNIEVMSSLGEGTSFLVRLPLAPTTPPPVPHVETAVLVGLRAAESCSLVRALTARGVAVSVQAPETGTAARADLVVVASEVLEQRSVLDGVRRALARGQRLAVVCDPGDASATAPKLPGGGRVIERPLRLRHLMWDFRGGCDSGPEAEPAGPRLVGHRVLAAEDNEVNRLVLAGMLEDEGAEVVFAENGRIAVDAVGQADSSGFDVVLMDIQMPEMGGFEATRLILAGNPQLPIIGLTAHAMPQERQRCLDAGMVEHLAKPFALDDLVAVVLRHSRGAQPAAPGSAARSAPAGGDDAPTAPVIDWAGLESRFSGKTKFIDKLAAAVLKAHAEAPAELRAAARQGDREKLAFAAHSIKGMAGNMMAAEVQGLAKAAEAAARTGGADAGERAEQLAAAAERLLAEVAARLQSTGSQKVEAMYG